MHAPLEHSEYLLTDCRREHQAQDDAELQRIHEAAIAGKFRGKRRGGVDLADSDDDEDDEEARRIRRKMHKKRRVEGDTLEDLGMSARGNTR